ncbi:MAG TPA: HAD-IIA family hydrolase [Oscillospiraceae bacterium]|nr:HAD-IIA family hydrolase [Oscillospiraceae bacterium]HPF55472.1 HAD-IIA family hydrolase [Clostridiales bacterium]HPK34306.1 HAD-IIA family hydrolase [Oscillospiraceae bacterium]HPR75085.1 HAD-IIA family hydrolase [Oscillospiraceae bacterium]
MKDLKKIKYFVLDMDGTIYLGDKLFDFTPAFLNNVKETNRDFVFFTNNSSKNAAAYIEKLHKMGIDITPDKMLISNEVIIEYIQREYPGKSVYVIGTELLKNDFIHAGIKLTEDADLVVLGFDTELVYHKLVVGCDLIRAGKPFLAVNPDFNCPVENGFIPDCGSMARLITASTGVVPEFFGKPSHHALEYMLRRMDCKPSELAVVGDRLYTDIAIACGTDVTSILVLSGETNVADLKASEFKPDIVVQDLAELSMLL